MVVTEGLNPWIMRNCISIHGVWMYPPQATTGLVNLIAPGS